MTRLTDIIVRDTRVLFPSLVLAVSLYLIMVLGPLARLEAIAGMAPFDMRPGGYSLIEAETLIAALGEEGRRVYLTIQIPLDMIYPGLLGLTLFIALTRVAAGLGGAAGRALRALRWLAILAALADYAENLMIVMMLTGGDEPAAALVASASTASMAKAGLTTLAASALLVGVALVGARWLIGRRA